MDSVNMGNRAVFIYVLLAILIGVSAFRVTSTHAAKEKPTTLTAAVPAEYPPLYQLDKKGAPTGFAIDILEHVASQAGLQVRYVIVKDWADAMALVRTGNADFIPGIGISQAREQEFIFTHEIESVPVSCFVREQDTRIGGIEDLPGVKTAVIRQSAAFTRLHRQADIPLVEFDSMDSALLALLAGEVDAFVFPKPVLEKKARAIGISDRIKTVGKPLRDLKRGYLLNKANTSLRALLNPHIRSLVTSPEYARLYLKWYGEPELFWNSKRIFILMSIILGISIIGLLLWRSVSLSRLNRRLMASMEKLKESEDALRAKEQYLHLLQKNAPDALYLVDAGGRIIDVNDRSCEMLGYTREAMLQMTISDIDPDFPSSDQLTLILERMESGIPVSLARTHRRSDGSLFQVDINICIFDNQGARLVLGVARDVSDRIRMEEEIRQAHKMHAIGQLAGGIAHDFNNILAGIMGYAELLVDEFPKDSTTAGYLNQILQSSERARALIKQILTFSRKETEKMTVVSLATIANEVLKLIAASVPSSIRINTNIDENAAPVLADGIKVHETLMNLVSNAVDAMNDKGELNVGLTTRKLTESLTGYHGEIQPGDWTVLSVSDTGGGMPPDVLARAFDPFFTTKPVGKGTGMGLSVVYGVMRSLNGDIVVHSRQGEGTTFDLYFPASDKELSGLLPIPEQSHGGSERILLVDDEKVLVEMGEHMLRSLGYHVTVFTRPDTALAYLRSNPDQVDLLVTDQTMPDLTGAELIKKMRSIRPDLPTVLCTGYSRIMDEVAATEEGINGFVMKPYRKSTLGQAIRNVLSEKRNSDHGATDAY